MVRTWENSSKLLSNGDLTTAMKSFGAKKNPHEGTAAKGKGKPMNVIKLPATHRMTKALVTPEYLQNLMAQDTAACPYNFELGKEFLPELALENSNRLHYMRLFQNWYLGAVRHGLPGVPFSYSPKEVFGVDNDTQKQNISFEDIQYLYCQKKFDINQITLWCIKVWKDSAELSTRNAILHPQMIYEATHAGPQLWKRDHPKIKGLSDADRKKFDHFILAIINVKGGCITMFDSIRQNQKTYNSFISILQTAYRFYVSNGGQYDPKKQRKIDVCYHELCARQPAGVLCGYYVCHWMRVTGQYYNNPKIDDACKHMSHEIITQAEIQEVQEDFCKFIMTEVVKTGGAFFDPESEYATETKCSNLRLATLSPNFFWKEHTTLV